MIPAFLKGGSYDYLDLKTNEDGSDLAMHIDQIFSVLNKPKENGFKNIDESLDAFPYVNGKLFEEDLFAASFDGEMRRILLDSCLLDWGKISPAIFGSLFQSVMDEKARRNLGAHYTSEKSIMKLIKPLFLDELWQEYEKAKGDKRALKKLHEKISKLLFLDPACGCGNFLIIFYRELRLLELEIVKGLLKGQQITSINDYFLVDVDQFYGIEYEEFPSQIAQVAMWLMDHQMNEAASLCFGEYFKRIPLKKSATIVHGNALDIEWQSLINPSSKENSKFSYILGNPPFLGKQYQNKVQKEDMIKVFNGVKSAGALDYVTAWYIRAAQYIKIVNQSHILNQTLVAFVSTNSITQGAQVSILWIELFKTYTVKIHFAHRTFKWGNEARGNAAVHVVIIGFSNFDISEKRLFEYHDIRREPHELKVHNINPYLVEGRDEYVVRRKQPICNVPGLIKGNQPTDNGNYLFTSDERNEFLIKEPSATKWFKRFIGSSEFINNEERWCLWLKDISPSELKQLPSVYERVQNVRTYRLKSLKAATVKKATTPALFDEIRHTGKDYLGIPEVSSERRIYLPIGYMNGNVISSNKNYMLPSATLFQFGILNSIMHNVWTKNVSERLKSDIQYSNGIVYNNFPWPENPPTKQRDAIERAAQSVLDVRATFPESSLADLYDPNTMPPALVKARQHLDKAVDLAYRSQPFINETKRIEYLFELYDKYTSGMFAKGKKRELPKP